MPEAHDFWLFLSASFLLWITPGPDTMYILARTVSQGHLAGLLSVFGVSAGVLAHRIFAAIGLSAILASSALAFTVVKFSGAAYLIYLGIQALRSNRELSAASGMATQSRSKIFNQGFVTNLLNPKIAIFFLAFLPQFVSPDSNNSSSTFLFLGGIFVLGGTLWCFLLVVFAAGFTGAIRSNARLSGAVGKVTGLVYIGLGLNLLRAKL
ncbi:homoserine/homoserine lactone efflux protein [Alcanivorax sp. 521-1]|uniref:Homoserine/homoserine lactone efflux protein n=1 Tax=Alloalcanivorax profundimaris TaxID=2735259 RepID=A0ABS0AWA2_9GAMM|nr:LysE family translocator [Alloalcanivorax profundimaris]MBF5058406.1 homoserine/homoserine lactone efflux protein [Alloalcanivorax profundimaris]